MKKETRQRYLIDLAGGALTKFAEISNSARQVLGHDVAVKADFLATGNTFNAPKIVQTLVEDAHAVRSTAGEVSEEPAIARVVTSDEQGNTRTFYINRIVSWDVGAGVIGYRTPMGRIASVPAGEEVTIAAPGGVKTFTILERALLHPRSVHGAWDSVNSNVERDGDRPVTITSFRALLPTVPEGSLVNTLDELLAEERASENIKEGIRRSVITMMALRDRPILDQIQDEIFRLPLDTHLLVLGPPGSGKTTTLIRRLGQKLDATALDEREKALVERFSISGQQPYGQSWLMFTPTELLKQYVKEAFAREGIPAPDQRIKTWVDYGKDLARNTFRILKSGTGRGSFILREKKLILLEATLEQQIEWFEDFHAWQDLEFWRDLAKEAEGLAASKNAEAAALGVRLIAALKVAASKSIAEKFLAIAALREDVQSFVDKKRELSKFKIESTINLQVNRDRALLDQIAKQLEAFSEEHEDLEEQDPLEDDEEDSPVSRSGRLAAFAAFGAALRAQARVEATNRRISRHSRNARLLEWLGDRSLAPEDRVAVGENIESELSARRFLAPARRYIDGLPARYRRYRRLQQDGQKWYRADEIESSRISPLEVDLILLASLRASKGLLREARIQRDLENPAFAFLKQVGELLHIQIFVDEATDFSPIQLACMEALGTPDLRAFFSCGDFNQRITEWGVRSESEFQWAVPALGLRTLTTTYRHSRKLNDFASELVRIASGVSNAVLPESVDSEGVAPALGINLRNPSEISAWLAKRIKEVEQITEVVPSIAVLVNSEAEVSPMAEALSIALADQNIRAVPCSNGQTLGQGTDVRVFDVQHIKGLEFEAVFFVSIDKFAEQAPKLFDKYLYVGVTRAATYLGVTCEGGGLPSRLEPLERMFERAWSS
jgi:hypothetical protein